MLKVRFWCRWWWWWWWVWGSVGAGLARAATPCLPKVEVGRISQNPQRPYVYAPWTFIRLEAKTIPTDDCQDPPSNLNYCWNIRYNKTSVSRPKPWDWVAECPGNIKGPLRKYGPYYLSRGTYTVQMVAMLPGSKKPRREVLGFFVVVYTKEVPFYFQGGEKAVIPHKTDLSFNIGGGRDPDKRPGKPNIMKLSVRWECSTDDEKAKSWCDGDLKDVSEDIFRARTIREIQISPDKELYAEATLAGSYVRPGYVYKITAKATEMEWPYRIAEATTERQILDSGPAPLLWIKCYEPCNLQRMLPTEKLRLEAKCGAFPPCIAGVSIYYKWIVTQDGVGPVDLVKYSEEGKSSGVGFDKLTIIADAFKPGGKITVELRTNYYPTAPEEVKAYQKAYDEYKKFQQEKA